MIYYLFIIGILGIFGALWLTIYRLKNILHGCKTNGTVVNAIKRKTGKHSTSRFCEIEYKDHKNDSHIFYEGISAFYKQKNDTIKVIYNKQHPNIAYVDNIIIIMAPILAVTILSIIPLWLALKGFGVFE